MPYTSLNVATLQNATFADWWNMANVRELHRNLMTVDYSVVDSRRDGQANLQAFLERGFDGGQLFGSETRFPNTMADLYLTNYQDEISNLLGGLQSVLSWRSTTVAKDIDAGRARDQRGSPTGGDQGQAAVSEQGSQDNTKRFEMLRRDFANISRKRDFTWERQSFEYRLNLSWVNP